MDKKSLFLGAVASVFAFSSCSTNYQITGFERSRILIDSRYDNHPDAQAAAFIEPYKLVVDSVMSPVVGHLAHSISADKPESALSNLLADILVWSAKEEFGEDAALGVYNMGGIRASLSEGDVTFGDVLEVAPFENKICFLTLKGDKLMELFRNMAVVHGEGVSHGVQLVITKDGRLKSARLHGKEIDPNSDYRVATIDYLAQGNDKLSAFSYKTNFVSPQEDKNDTRYIICDYFRMMDKEGIVVDPKIEGRIKYEDYETE